MQRLVVNGLVSRAEGAPETFRVTGAVNLWARVPEVLPLATFFLPLRGKVTFQNTLLELFQLHVNLG